MFGKTISISAAAGLLFAAAVLLCPQLATAAEGQGSTIGSRLPMWSVVPFIGILLSIALFPLFAPRWWHRHFPKVSAFWGLILAVPFVIAYRSDGIHEILHVYFLEYFPFIILLWALFTISGGMHVKGTLTGTPAVNLVMILVGTVIASWVGTTGASMIMIRPLLRANRWRRHKVHVIVFFIFLVSNIGGSLTPLGDPPLFLGFLEGVPFFWTMQLLPETLLVVLPLLLVFYLMDRWYYRREQSQDRPDTKEAVPLRIDGIHNILLLLGVVGSVFWSGVWHAGHVNVLGVHITGESLVRDGSLIVLGLVSLRLTRREVRAANEFSWFPIQEVAYLFAGIFMTIVPAIAILQAGEDGALGFIMTSLHSPAHYFWVTGSLSSFLDNAPSYLTFLNSLLGKFFAGFPPREGVAMLIEQQGLFLKAISIGAVFCGALTYIGNAPNFMVKSIAEEAGVAMPSFFGYMFKYSVPFLIPLFVIVTLVFF